MAAASGEMREVTREVTVSEKRYTLDLSEAEAAALMRLTGQISRGTDGDNPGKHTDAVYDALSDAGVTVPADVVVHVSTGGLVWFAPYDTRSEARSA